LRPFKKHHVIGTLLPDKEISILPEKFLTDSEEKLWQEKDEQFRQAASVRMNALLSELEYVQLKAGYYMAQETAAREKMASAETAQERFEYAQAVRDYQWLHYHLVRYHGQITTGQTARLPGTTLNQIAPKISELNTNIGNYLINLNQCQKRGKGRERGEKGRKPKEEEQALAFP
jgi:hypothetical protein